MSSPCKDQCRKIKEAVHYKNRKKYKMGTTGLKCSTCEIHLPINYIGIRFDKNGRKICPCCGCRLSGRINAKKHYIEQLVACGKVVRY
jgi:hypothetical protein